MQSRSVWQDSLILFFVLGIVYFIALGCFPFLTPDEGRYVEIPREMLATGDYIVPHLNGVPYFEKPPLFYWMQTLSLSWLGSSTWAMRAWVALLGVVGCVLTYLLSHKIWDRQTGLVSATVQSTAFLYFGMSHSITLDAPLTFFLTLCLYSLIYGIWYLDQGKKYLSWFYCAYAFSALAVMTKGLIGVVFPTMIIGLWVMLTQRWSLLIKLHIIPGLILIVAVCFPWHYLAFKAYPEFLNFYFIDQQLARYATPIAQREMNKLVYFAILILGLFPWTIFLGPALKQAWASKSTETGPYGLFMAVWALAIFIFFLFSHSVLVPYLLPVVPPCSILLGRYLSERFDEPVKAIFRAVLLCLALILGLGFFLAPYFKNMGNQVAVSWHFSMIAILFFGLGLIAWTQKKSYAGWVKKVTLCCLVLYTAMILTMSYANTRSVYPLTTVLNPLLKNHPEARVIAFDEYYQDMSYYLNRTVMVAGWRNELTFGMQLEPSTQDWMISIPKFWSVWQEPTLAYAIGPIEFYAEAQKRGAVCLLAQTLEHVLLLNRSCQP